MPKVRWNSLIVLSSLWATVAAADFSLGEVSLGSWDGSLEVDTGASKDRSVSGGTPTTFNQHNTLYLLNIQNSGFSIIDPGLMIGTAGITLGTGKDTARGQDITSTVSSGLRGYTFDAEFLNDLPYGGGLYANHSSSTVVQPFGHQDNNSSNRGVRMRLNEGSPLKDLGFPYLSANLRLEEQNLDQVSTSALNQTYRFSEHRRSLVQDGHKGAESSDLNWRMEVADVKQPLNQMGSNRTKAASLDYSADLGEQLNKRWDSRIDYSDRTGIASLLKLSTLTISEILQVAHQSNLTTNYNYQLMRTVSQDVPSLSQTGSFNVQYQPYQNLSATGSIQHQKLPTGQLDSGSGALGYQYLYNLPAEGKLRFTAGGGYGLTKTTTINTTGHIDYEPHPFKFDALAVGQEVTFGHSFVNLSAPIQLYAYNVKLNQLEAALVACPSTTLPADGSCDYVILPPLGNKTVIRINPLSTTLSGLGNNIDALAVSYSFNVLPSMTYATVTSQAGLLIDYRWLVITLTHTASSVHERSDSDSPFLQSGRQERAQVDLKGAWRDIQATTGVAYLVSNETLLVYKQQHYYGSATYPYSYDLSLNLGADKLVTHYQTPDRSNETSTIRFGAIWYPVEDLVVNALIARRSMADSKQAKETVDEASLKAQYKYGKIRLNSAVSMNRRVSGTSELSNWRLDVNLVRSL